SFGAPSKAAASTSSGATGSRDATGPTSPPRDASASSTGNRPASSRQSAGSKIADAKPGEVDLTGQAVGGFEIHKMLGHGGMGAVCLARQVSLDRNVALKILPGRMAQRP